MEALTQSLKIGAGLAAMVAAAVVLMPERPTLLGGGDAVAAQDSPLAAGALAPASTPSEPAELEIAQATPPATTAQPSEGQRHLERLRQLRSGSVPSTGAPSAAAPQPAPETQEAPAASPPPREAATPQAPAAGDARGLGSLTQPAGRPQYRLFRQTEALDTATIRADGETIRLAGIVPVSSEARCSDGTPCGTEGRQALGTWLAEREVLCAVTPGAAQAPCVRGEDDIGEWVVANGWAMAEPGSVYQPAEDRARDAGLGIWGAGGL